MKSRVDGRNRRMVRGRLRWFRSRPPIIREMVTQCPPNLLYRMRSTKQVVTILAYGENRTVRVFVGVLYNPFLLFEREVFGVDIDDLERV